MAELFLDTTVLIDALRGRGAADRLAQVVTDGVVPFVCAVNVEELWLGARPGDEAAIERLLRGLRLAPLGMAEARRAGIWRREFATRGVTLGQADCLIAAAALGVGAHLATANVRDYPMREVVVEDWAD